MRFFIFLTCLVVGQSNQAVVQSEHNEDQELSKLLQGSGATSLTKPETMVTLQMQHIAEENIKTFSDISTKNGYLTSATATDDPYDAINYPLVTARLFYALYDTMQFTVAVSSILDSTTHLSNSHNDPAIKQKIENLLLTIRAHVKYHIFTLIILSRNELLTLQYTTKVYEDFSKVYIHTLREIVVLSQSLDDSTTRKIGVLSNYIENEIGYNFDGLKLLLTPGNGNTRKGVSRLDIV